MKETAFRVQWALIGLLLVASCSEATDAAPATWVTLLQFLLLALLVAGVVWGVRRRHSLSGVMKIVVFIPFTLMLWVAISSLIWIAYSCLPADEVRFSECAVGAYQTERSAAGQDTEPEAAPQTLAAARALLQDQARALRATRDSLREERASADWSRSRAWYILVLPLAMLIAGLSLWPSDTRSEVPPTAQL
ncbi:MAG: hypothetical protein WD766_09245 [Gemmatimonadota bacterium]